jgi:hypothetical protein
LLRRDGDEDAVRGLLDAVEAFGEELRVALVKLDVILRGGASCKADSAAHDKRHGLGFGLADALRGSVAPLIAMQHFVSLC